MARPLLDPLGESSDFTEDLDVIPERDRRTACEVAAIAPLVELGLMVEAELDVLTTSAEPEALLVCRVAHGEWDERLQVSLTALVDDYVRAHAGPDGRIDDFVARRRAAALSRALADAATRLEGAIMVPPRCKP